MRGLSLSIHKFANRIVKWAEFYQLYELRGHIGYLDLSAELRLPEVCPCPEKIFMEAGTSIWEGAIFIMSPIGDRGTFLMKKGSGAAQGLKVITNLHHRVNGRFCGETENSHINDEDKDVIVEEDVSIGVNVTLMPGVKVGRGASIGACSVCVNNIPPYAVVMGNPAQVVGFTFTPEEIIEHEKALYPEEERLPLAKLEKNYKKYYLDQMQHIAGYMSLNMLPNV